MMRRRQDNLRLLGQSTQRWQAKNSEFASSSMRSVSSWKDIRTLCKRFQKRLRRAESTKGEGGEVRKMARGKMVG